MLTGASGFVGQATLVALARRNVETIAVSRTRPSLSGSSDWRQVDLLDLPALERAVENIRPDIILHLAWTVEPGLFWTAPANLDWVVVTLTLSRAARRAGARRLIGTGTCSEYDWSSLIGDCNEDKTPLKPALLYGIAKDATRRVLEAFGPPSDLDIAWARLFYIYGAGERGARLIPVIASALALGKPALCASGSVVRDYMEVRDAGEALAALAMSDVTGAVNIGSGTGVAVSEIARMLGDLAGRPDLIKLGALPDRADDPPRIVANIARLRDEVGFWPPSSLEAGLRNALAYWSRH